MSVTQHDASKITQHTYYYCYTSKGHMPLRYPAHEMVCDLLASWLEWNFVYQTLSSSLAGC